LSKKIHHKNFRLDHTCNYSLVLNLDRLSEIKLKPVSYSQYVDAHYKLLWEDPKFAVMYAKRVAKYIPMVLVIDLIPYLIDFIFL
jgi:hypothetical protein